MQNTQKLKILVFSLIAFIAVGSLIANNTATGLVDSLKDILQCPSSSLFLYACVLYTFLLAIPYVPALELGLLLMVYFGKPGIAAAYICTFIGLNIAFAIGRLASKYMSHRHTQLEDASWQSIIMHNRFFTTGAKHFMERQIQQYKYLSIGILLNLPGNWLVGGGGGISLLCGYHSSNSWPKFVITVAIATSILPLLIYLGLISIESLIETMDGVINN